MTVAFDGLREAGVATRTACTLTGRARASHYRRLRPPAVRRPPIPQSERRAPTQALSPVERAAVLGVLNTVGNADLSIGQVWVRELDEGRYWCSLSSMYRIAAAAGQTRERRAQATHPAKVKPELLADVPSQVWSWDITKLRGPTKGVWFHLYVLIDIYSRYNPGWIVAAREDSALAKDFLDEAITRNSTVPHTVHADRGTSMTSKPVSALLVDLGVTRSHSRPRVSNDCPLLRSAVQDEEVPLRLPPILRHRPGRANVSVKDSSPSTTTFIAIPGSDGIPLLRSTSAPLAPSTRPARSPSTRPRPRTQNGSPAAQCHHESPSSPGSTNPNQNYRTPDHRTVSLDLTDTDMCRLELCRMRNGLRSN